MAVIGTWGDITFAVSRNQIKTFDGLEWDSGAKYSTHDRHLKEPLLEFTGTDVESMTFSSAFQSCSPLKPPFQIPGRSRTRVTLRGRAPTALEACLYRLLGNNGAVCRALVAVKNHVPASVGAFAPLQLPVHGRNRHPQPLRNIRRPLSAFVCGGKRSSILKCYVFVSPHKFSPPFYCR